MAYSVEYSPATYVAGSKADITYVVYDDTNTSEPKYTYLCDVYVGGSKVARLSALPNGTNAGVFDISRVVDDYLLYQIRAENNQAYPITYLGKTGGGLIFCENNASALKVEVKFGYKYAADANSAPTVYADEITGNFVTVIKAHPLGLKFTGHEGSFVGNNPGWDDYGCEDADGKFLSAVPRVDRSADIVSTSYRYDQSIMQGQDHVISWLNDATTSAQALAPRYLHVAGYNSSGSQIFQQHIQNTALYGGNDPNTTSTDAGRLIFFGSGVTNLQQQTANTTLRIGMLNAALSYYEVVASDSTTLGANQSSAVYRFNILPQCKYKTRRIMFINALGGWDFFNFDLISEETVSLERSEYTRIKGNWSTAGDAVPFRQNHFERGRTTLNTRATLREKMNTDWVGEEWNDFFTQLFASPEVYVIDTEGLYFQIPVIITDTQQVRSTSENKGLNSYQITVEYSNELNV